MHVVPSLTSLDGGYGLLPPDATLSGWYFLEDTNAPTPAHVTGAMSAHVRRARTCTDAQCSCHSRTWLWFWDAQRYRWRQTRGHGGNTAHGEGMEVTTWDMLNAGYRLADKIRIVPV